jgi:hypothetical protein
MNKQKNSISIKFSMVKFLSFKETIYSAKFKFVLLGLVFFFRTLNAQPEPHHIILGEADIIRKHAGFTTAYIKAIIEHVFQYQFTNSAISFIKELLENDEYYSYEEIYKFIEYKFLDSKEAAFFSNVARLRKVINPEKSLGKSRKAQRYSLMDSLYLSKSMKALQVQMIPTHPDPEKLYKVATFLDSSSYDFESMDKIANGIHDLLSTTTLIDDRNSLLREIYIERRLQLYIENLSGEQKSEFIALLYEKILPVTIKNMFKKQIPNRDLNHYTGTKLIACIETYILIYKRLSLFRPYNNFASDQYHMIPLKIKDLNISAVTLDDMSSFLELLHNPKTEDTFIKNVAQKIVYLIFDTTAFINKEDQLYYIFYDHLNVFYMSLNKKNKILLMRSLAEEINRSIETSPYFKSLLEKEAQNPLLSLDNYIKIFSKCLNAFILHKKIFIDNKIKETGVFIQPRKFYNPSTYHVLSTILNLTPDRMHIALKQLNHLFLNTYISKFPQFWNLYLELREFAKTLSSDENKQLRKLLLEEMIESIDLCDEFKRFLEDEKINPKLSIKQYFRIYKHLMEKYHAPEDENYIHNEILSFDEYSLQININPEYHVTSLEIIEIKNLLEDSPEYRGLSITEIAQKISRFLTRSDFLYIADNVTYEYFFNQPFKKYYGMLRRDERDELSRIINFDVAESLTLFRGEEFKKELLYIYNVKSLIEEHRFLTQNTVYSEKFREPFQGLHKNISHKLEPITIHDWGEISSLLTSNDSAQKIIEKIINLGFYTDFFFGKDRAIKDIFFNIPFVNYLRNTQEDQEEFKSLFLLKFNEKLNQIKGFKILKEIITNKTGVTDHLTIRDFMILFEKVMEEITHQNES